MPFVPEVVWMLVCISSPCACISLCVSLCLFPVSLSRSSCICVCAYLPVSFSSVSPSLHLFFSICPLACLTPLSPVQGVSFAGPGLLETRFRFGLTHQAISQFSVSVISNDDIATSVGSRYTHSSLHPSLPCSDSMSVYNFSPSSIGEAWSCIPFARPDRSMSVTWG